MLQHATHRARRRVPPTKAVSASAVPSPPLVDEDVLRLLPAPLCSLGAILDRATPMRVGQPCVYLLWDADREPTSGGGGRLVYVGLTGLSPWERMRRHAARRRPGTEISRLDVAIGLSRQHREWLVTVAPPAAYVPFVRAALWTLRERLLENGSLPPRLDGRLLALLDRIGDWATPRVIEWCLIAALCPQFNGKGNVYGSRGGEPARPVPFLLRFSEMATQEMRGNEIGHERRI